jgi:hypothetical protein
LNSFRLFSQSTFYQTGLDGFGAHGSMVVTGSFMVVHDSFLAVHDSRMVVLLGTHLKNEKQT